MPEISRGSSEIILTGPQRRYVRDVLRMERGDPLLLFDGSGWEFPATILETTPRQVCIQILGKHRGRRDSFLEIELAMGLLKTNKMDLVIQKATELGVHDIRPVSTQRAVLDLPPDRAEKRQARWQKIAQEASRQSGRATVSCVHPVTCLGDVLGRARTMDLAFLFTTCPAPSLGETLPHGPQDPRRILLLVGPEGGFSEEEKKAAERHGFILTALGPRVLRAETAAILAVGLVQYRFGDLGGKASKDPLGLSNHQSK